MGLDSLPAQRKRDVESLLEFQPERERKALLDKFLGEVQNRVSGRAFLLSFSSKKMRSHDGCKHIHQLHQQPLNHSPNAKRGVAFIFRCF